MTSLIQHIYWSCTAPDFREHEIPDLLRQIRPANAKHGITGMLVYSGTAFLQVLEGDSAKVNAVFDRIGCDPRHQRVTTLRREPLQRRLFPDWTMDFVTLDPVDIDDIIGGPSVLTGTLNDHLEPALALRLIDALRKPSWQTERRLKQMLTKKTRGNCA